MNLIWHITLSVISFCIMEGVAWFSHKYIMHGFLWHLHKDHHKKESKGFLEKNDYFFVLFATPGALLIILGSIYIISEFVFVGIGISMYGLSYFLIHDVFIHQRIRWFRNTRSTYMIAIRKAHKIHHKNVSKEKGIYFGMLYVPKKYFTK
jgi:beta-carotene 3-hydroxylase